MKPIVEKLLSSGIVERGFVELMERWGNLPEGSSDLLKNETLKNATKEHLTKFSEEIANEVANRYVLKETQFDLDRLRWPATVDVYSNEGINQANHINAVIDRMGRYFFRIQDVQEGWFVPGYTLRRHQDHLPEAPKEELILEATPLYMGDDKIALQVTTQK